MKEINGQSLIYYLENTRCISLLFLFIILFQSISFAEGNDYALRCEFVNTFNQKTLLTLYKNNTAKIGGSTYSFKINSSSNDGDKCNLLIQANLLIINLSLPFKTSVNQNVQFTSFVRNGIGPCHVVDANDSSIIFSNIHFFDMLIKFYGKQEASRNCVDSLNQTKEPVKWQHYVEVNGGNV